MINKSQISNLKFQILTTFFVLFFVSVSVIARAQDEIGVRQDNPNHLIEVYFSQPLKRSLEKVIQDLNLTVYPEDKVRVFPDLEFGLGGKIEIERALVARVNDGGVETTYRTWQENVRDLLEEKNIEIGDDDILTSAPEVKLSSDIEIKIIRVAVTQIKQKEAIDFKTITKNDLDLEKGKSRIGQEGIKGEKVKTYEVRRENGKEVDRKLLKTEITRDPQDKIIYKGTKIVNLGSGKATWYSANGMVAAHNSLPRGTKVLVTNTANGKSVTATVVGGGIGGGAIIDLSPEAFKQIADLGEGVINVRLEKGE